RDLRTLTSCSRADNSFVACVRPSRTAWLRRVVYFNGDASMKCVRVLFVSLVCCGVASSMARAQPPMPKPGPEQELLKKLEGTWDVTIQMNGQESKGTATYKPSCGGMWIKSDFQGDMGGMKFEGTGLDGYNSADKQYESVWVDSMSPKSITMRGNYDADKKTMTMTGDGLGQDMKPAKYKSVSEWKDDDTFVFTMNLEQDGKDQPMFTMTYKRKK